MENGLCLNYKLAAWLCPVILTAAIILHCPHAGIKAEASPKIVIPLPPSNTAPPNSSAEPCHFHRQWRAPAVTPVTLYIHRYAQSVPSLCRPARLSLGTSSYLNAAPGADNAE